MPMPTQTAQGRQSDKQTETAKIVPQNTTNETETQKKTKTPVPVEEGPARPPAHANIDASYDTYANWRRYNIEHARAVEEAEYLNIRKNFRELSPYKRFEKGILCLIGIVAMFYFLWNVILLVVWALFSTLVLLGLMQDPRQAFDTCNAMFNEEAVEAAAPVVAEAIKSIVGNITEFATLDH